MRRHLVLVPTLLGAVVAFATTPSAPLQPGASVLVLYHAWTSPSDLSALDALVNVFKKTYPGVGVETALAEAPTVDVGGSATTAEFGLVVRAQLAVDGSVAAT